MQIELDFLEEPFQTYKCSRCRKEYRYMSFSLGTRTCPPCSNKSDEGEISPEELLTVLDEILETDKTILNNLKD